MFWHLRCNGRLNLFRRICCNINIYESIHYDCVSGGFWKLVAGNHEKGVYIHRFNAECMFCTTGRSVYSLCIYTSSELETSFTPGSWFVTLCFSVPWKTETCSTFHRGILRSHYQSLATGEVRGTGTSMWAAGEAISACTLLACTKKGGVVVDKFLVLWVSELIVFPWTVSIPGPLRLLRRQWATLQVGIPSWLLTWPPKKRMVHVLQGSHMFRGGCWYRSHNLRILMEWGKIFRIRGCRNRCETQAPVAGLRLLV